VQRRSGEGGVFEFAAELAKSKTISHLSVLPRRSFFLNLSYCRLYRSYFNIGPYLNLTELSAVRKNEPCS
jgi:hypothetical protein